MSSPTRERGALASRPALAGPVAVAMAIMLLAGGCVSGGMPAGATSREQDAILGVFQTSADAWNEGDLAGQLSIYADDVTFMSRSDPVRPITIR